MHQVINAQWHAKVGLPLFYTPCIIWSERELESSEINITETLPSDKLSIFSRLSIEE